MESTLKMLGMVGFSSWDQIIPGIVRLIVAALCGALIGVERGRRHRPAGLRTHMLVCVASALVMVTNEQILNAMGGGDPTRMGAQVISGIGFLGAGTILIDRQNRVRGLTTAAGLWASACIGLAIGAGYYIGGFVTCGLTLLIFVRLIDVEKKFVRKSRMMELYVEFNNSANLTSFLADVTSNKYNVLAFETVSPSSKGKKDTEKQIAANLSIWIPTQIHHDDVIQSLESSKGLITIEEL